MKALIFALFVSIFAISCGQTTKTEETVKTEDSTTVKTDTVKVDTTTTDSTDAGK